MDSASRAEQRPGDIPQQHVDEPEEDSQDEHEYDHHSCRRLRLLDRRQVWEFALGSRIELRKMVWPTVKQAQMTTGVVVIFVVVLGVFFWLVDMLLGFITRSLLGAGG